MKKLYYSNFNDEGKQLFKQYCVSENISSFKMQNFFSGNYPIPEAFKKWAFEDFQKWLNDEGINFLDEFINYYLIK